MIGLGLMMVILLIASAACGASRSAPITSTTAYPATTSAPLTKAPMPDLNQHGSAGFAPPTATVSAAMPPVQTVQPTIMVTVPPQSSGPNYYASDQSTTIPDRMVVRTGNLQLVVSDVAGALDNIVTVAKANGGFVVNSQKWKEGERNIGSISIRVLSESYDKTIASLRALAVSVISESSSSQDVTQEYVDLDSRVKNLEATETQLLKIMETATKTEDILNIQRELTNVRGEIEQIKGRMQYLERTSSTSLIDIGLSEASLDLKFNADKTRVDVDETIRFTAEVTGGFAPYSYLWDFGDGNTSVDKAPTHSYKAAGNYTVTFKVSDDKGYTNSLTRSEYISVVGSWNAGSIAKTAWGGFVSFGHVMVNILIWIGIFSPVWIIIGGIIWFIIYRNRKKNRMQG